jgi:hypothetical protein
MLFHPANKRPLVEWLVGRVLLQRALSRAFGGVYTNIHPDTLRLRKQTHLPIVFCATHSGWWDGHMAYILNKRVFRRDAYLMMEEAQLAQYLFFTWFGVFGVDKRDPRAALESIRYITGMLSQRENAALWIFPQGEMSHPDARPLRIYGGVTNIARRLGECVLVPVALRYDFLLEQAPHAFAQIGSPLMVQRDGESRDLAAKLASAMTSVADDLHQDVTSYRLDGYRKVLSGRGSANTNWARVRAAAGSVAKRLGW